jgi:hypothetical protein
VVARAAVAKEGEEGARAVVGAAGAAARATGAVARRRTNLYYRRHHACSPFLCHSTDLYPKVCPPEPFHRPCTTHWCASPEPTTISNPPAACTTG